MTINNDPSDAAMTTDELLATFKGENLDAYRKRKEILNSVQRESKKYIKKPPSEWPKLQFNWDLTEDGQHYSFDGLSQDELRNCYPNGLNLGWVNNHELNKALHSASQRNDDELWMIGCSSKTARMIAYLARGEKISPPAVKLVDNKIVFVGGNHRYVIFKISGGERLPLYIDPKDVKAINSVLTINWVHAN